MATAETTRDERERLEILEACGIFDSEREESFDFLAELAAETFGAPMAAISLIAGERLWFKSTVGLDDLREIQRGDSLCQHLLDQHEPLVIDDAAAQEPYCDSPLVSGALGVRTYAGAPLITEDGHVLGGLCIAHPEPGRASEESVRALTALADQVVALIERRRTEAELKRVVSRLEHGERLAHVGSWEWEVANDTVAWSPGLYRVWGIPEGTDVDFGVFADSLHPDDRERVLGIVRTATEHSTDFHYTARIVRPNGEVREIEAEGETEVNPDGATMTVRGAAWDVTEELRAERELRTRAQLLDRVEAAAVVGLDLDRRVTHWNHGAELLYGWARDEAIDRPVAALGLSPENWPGFKGEVEVRRKDGSSFPAFVTSSAVTGTGGEVVGYVGVSVDISEQKNAQQEVWKSRRETVHRLARAVETRDGDTGGHIERIGEYAAAIGERLGLDRDRTELLRISSPMHDVGKIGIADSILLKPGRLTAEERSEMELHAQIGHDLLAGSGTELLDLAATIALSHHEWIDGTGYPNGLRGDDIPLEGRIVAVADVFDALTSDRVYRKAFGHDEAILMMKSERGSQFDPAALDALLALLGE